MRRLLVTLAVIVVLAGGMASQAFGYMTTPEMNALSSWLAQRQVEVHCLTQDESDEDLTIALGALAYVEGWLDLKGNWHPFRTTVFASGLCETLWTMQGGDFSSYSNHDMALAALVLTHESGHLRGHRWSADEAKTECWAIRHVGYVLARIGVEQPLRQELVREAVAIHNDELAEGYQLPGCVLP
ncbi:MAG TPA: hypothetical protein VLA89_07225 [Gemmatimonadales bacterium]|nr:hypothetical protein [Gemmatimonadales bacterium]